VDGVAVGHLLVADLEPSVQHDLAFCHGASLVLVDTDRDAGLGAVS